ncbi:hypothetical protein MSPP1_001590 [Malassezia sp. CBS 17886]|nr:hypothetical protein MSPP1_001590 [Malassezia sp. CBS 17886]
MNESLLSDASASMPARSALFASPPEQSTPHTTFGAPPEKHTSQTAPAHGRGAAAPTARLERRVEELAQRLAYLEFEWLRHPRTEPNWGDVAALWTAAPPSEAQPARARAPTHHTRPATPDPFNPFWEPESPLAAAAAADAPPPAWPTYAATAVAHAGGAAREAPRYWLPAGVVGDPDGAAAPAALVQQVLAEKNQDACVALQQTLKRGMRWEQDAVIQALRPHLVGLSMDRFGNFLVQRALRVDPQLAWALKGAYVALVLSPFGTHVVQRAIDADEETQKMVVGDLLGERLEHTLTSRHAIHVWQKIFGIHWTDACVHTQLRRSIHGALHGRWASTAALEIGSVLCQHLLEAAIVTERDEGVEELLRAFPSCACNQFGVWVIQHLLEHSTAAMRARIAQHVLDAAAPVSLSQYGAKAVLAALRCGSDGFLHQYIAALCRPARHAARAIPSALRRPLLVDLAVVQHGLPIITHLLTNAAPDGRTEIINVVRKNAVMIKGNKAGQRIFQLCGMCGLAVC